MSKGDAPNHPGPEASSETLSSFKKNFDAYLAGTGEGLLTVARGGKAAGVLEIIDKEPLPDVVGGSDSATVSRQQYNLGVKRENHINYFKRLNLQLKAHDQLYFICYAATSSTYKLIAYRIESTCARLRCSRRWRR